MSGHSKWSKIKRQKGAADAKKGAEFTKLGNVIAVAAKEKGGDPETNFSLRMAMDKARAANMPKDNIEKAVKRGTGELGGGQIEEILYEGFGPGKAQFIIRALTDNKNRSAANIRHIFSKYGGTLGSVMWNFEKRGVVRIMKQELENYNANLRIHANASNYGYVDKEAGEEFELELIDAGVQDIKKEEEGITLITDWEDLQKVKKFLDEKKITTESAEIEYLAREEMEVGEDDKEKIENFIEALEENEDVSDYYTNANV